MGKSIIIDASLVGKWLLSDEQDLLGDLVKEGFKNKNISICVPIFLFYEVNNLLKSAVLSKRIGKKQAQELFEGFLDLDFIVYWSKDLLKNTLQKAIDLNVSSYDAAYIALAEHLQIPLYTSDQKLLLKAKNNLIRDLKDYK